MFLCSYMAHISGDTVPLINTKIYKLKHHHVCIAVGFYCITGNRNSNLFVFPIHKIIVRKFVYIVNCVVSYGGLTGRCEASWDCSICCVDRLFCPPHFYLSDMWRKLYICIPSPEKQFFSTQCHCHSGF
jgi:hypothetical protein